jgi:hypothetical protein
MASPPKLHPALLGGLFIGVVSALPYVKGLNGCCCLWLAVGGLLAAWVMQQNHPAPVTLADGAVAGLLSGLFGFVVLLIVSIPIGMLTGSMEADFSQSMLESTEGMTPEVRDLIRGVPPAAFAVLGGAIFLVIGSMVSTVGGVVGAAMFKRKVTLPSADAPMPAGWEAPAAVVPPPLPEPPLFPQEPDGARDEHEDGSETRPRPPQPPVDPPS